MEKIALTDIDLLWEYACSGNIKKLKEHYDNGGSVHNNYFKFGEAHSLIMGAFRNNQFDTVEYLMSVGEEITPKERMEIETEMRKLDIMQRLVEQKEQEFDMSQTQSM